MSKIEHGIAQDDHQSFVLALERAWQRLILRFNDDAFPDPLPELRLRCPELLAVAADHQRRAFLLFHFFLFNAQLFTRSREHTPLLKYRSLYLLRSRQFISCDARRRFKAAHFVNLHALVADARRNVFQNVARKVFRRRIQFFVKRF